MIAHLHVHSHYSFCDSTLAPEAIAALAVERGFTAIALTDTNSLAGAVAFYKACRDLHVQPILGAEVDDLRTGERAIVLVRDWTGWGALCRLLTDRNLQGEPEPEVVETLGGVWTKAGRQRQREEILGGMRRTQAANTQREEEEIGISAEGMSGEFDLREALAALPPDHTIVLTDSPGLLAFLSPLRGTGSARGEQAARGEARPPASPTGGYLFSVPPLAHRSPASRRDASTIAHRFNGGNPGARAGSPGGTAEQPDERPRSQSTPNKYTSGVGMPTGSAVVNPGDGARSLDGAPSLYAELILPLIPPPSPLSPPSPSPLPERRRAARATFDAARRLGLPIVATCDVHFAAPEDAGLHRILQAIGHGSTVGRLEWDQNRKENETGWGESSCALEGSRVAEPPSPAFHASPLPSSPSSLSSLPPAGLSPATSAPSAHQTVSPLPPPSPTLPPAVPSVPSPSSAAFAHHAPPPATSAPGWLLDRCDLRAAWKGLRGEIERSIGAIVDACRFEMPLGKWQLPQAHLPAGETPFSRLWKQAFAGLERRHPTLTREVIERLRHEIEIIDRLGFSNYFLVVNEIVEEARRRGLYVLGRGSAANSLVSYALGFTGVDPLRHHLYFERFLNPERGSPPDIDLDFSWKDRDAIVDWAFDRFGRDHVALISTTVRLQARQAIREVAKAMGLADSQISRITRPIPFWYSRSLDLERLEDQFPECRGLPLREEPWRTILAEGQRILGFPRHYGIHCGGIVITPEPIWRYLPLVRAAKGFVVTQMDMGPVEDLGLIKIDLLGNRSLGVYKDVLKMIEEEGARSESA